MAARRMCGRSSATHHRDRPHDRDRNDGKKRADADDNTDADDGCDKGLQGQKEGNRGRVAHRTDPAGRLRKIGAKIDQFVHNGISFHLSAPL